MQKWEYKHVNYEWRIAIRGWKWEDGGTQSQESRLTELGREGWELVSTVYHGNESGEISRLHFYFKRPLE